METERTNIPAKQRRRIKKSISISEATDAKVTDLRSWTDTDTESEAYRNAVRIHHYLVQAFRAGKPIKVGDEVLLETALCIPPS